ncbi:hypothetical protein M0R01_01430 [bacterium]|nr:hypothetical protein [bacterium]
MSIILAYFYWHYIERPKDLFNIMSNYVNFWVFFFSIERVIKSLFSPWKKIEYKVPKNVFDILVWADVIFSNIFSRVMGFIIRTVLILVFVLIEFLTLTLGVLVILFWILLPILLAYALFMILSETNV